MWGPQYPIPNKKYLIQRLVKSKVFSEFDMKSGFWQIQIAENDRYKTAFVVPFGHYEWNVMSFGLKNAPSEFQNMMNKIFNQFFDFIIIFIVDVLMYFIVKTAKSRVKTLPYLANLYIYIYIYIFIIYKFVHVIQSCFLIKFQKIKNNQMLN